MLLCKKRSNSPFDSGGEAIFGATGKRFPVASAQSRVSPCAGKFVDARESDNNDIIRKG
jgi:hypothetical protein